MCQACPPEQTCELPPGRRRRKLWEIDGQCHCIILGTCLGVGELRAIATQGGFEMVKSDPSDYEIHSAMVHLAGRDRGVGKALTRALDRKFALAIKRFARAGDREAVAQAWTESQGRGEIAGALWAVMSHPASDEALRARVFGEVHMLSHRVGAMVRSDMRQISALEAENANLKLKVQRQQERLQREITARDATICDLQALLNLEIIENRRHRDDSAATERMDALHSENEALRHNLRAVESRLQAAESMVQGRDEMIHGLELRLAEQAVELAALSVEAHGLEARLADRLADTVSPSCPEACNRPDLCGRCILYVGGRSIQVPHLQRLVAERNGVLIHHDGGVTDNLGRLQGMLGSADVVLFPVDCVSHAAHDRVKKLCRRWNKPFVPVRRTGLGAFIQALDSLSARSSS